MASIVIHMAITLNLINRGLEGSKEKLLTGNVLPDYIFNNNHHYKNTFCNREFFDLSEFRTKNADRMTDDIYIGYYLHLVQDNVFRDYMFNIHGWIPEKSRIMKLYGDYTALNGYLIDKYNVPTELLNDIGGNTLGYPEFRVNYTELNDEIQMYHRRADTRGYSYFFFTPDMAEEYIEKATELCSAELDALKGKGEYLNVFDYSWKNTYHKT